jgi:hypothetical protein
MSDTLKVILILGGITTGLLIVTHTKKRRGGKPFAEIQSGDAEPAGTGIDFNPAFVSTAATQSPLVTGEPETGNIVTAGICATANTMRPKQRGGCH